MLQNAISLSLSLSLSLFLSGNQRPDLRTSLMHMSLALSLPREMHLCSSSSKVPRMPSVFQLKRSPHILLTFGKVQNLLRLPPRTSLERPKMVRLGVLLPFWFEMCFAPQRGALFWQLNFQKCSDVDVFISKCASRHNRVHFFNSSTAKSVPTLKCFWHFDLETRFAPQSRHFCTSQLPKLLRAWAATCLRTRRFSEPIFRPSGATEHCKTTVLGNFAPYRAFWSSFYWLLPPMLLHLSISGKFDL